MSDDQKPGPKLGEILTSSHSLASELRKFGSTEDPVSHAEASRREAERAALPNTIRKTADQLNAEHEENAKLTAEVVAKLFGECSWDHVRNEIKARGHQLIKNEDFDAHRQEIRRAKNAERKVRVLVGAKVAECLALTRALDIILSHWDSEDDDPASIKHLNDAIRSAMFRLKTEEALPDDE